MQYSYILNLMKAPISSDVLSYCAVANVELTHEVTLQGNKLDWNQCIDLCFKDSVLNITNFDIQF